MDTLRTQQVHLQQVCLRSFVCLSGLLFASVLFKLYDRDLRASNCCGGRKGRVGTHSMGVGLECEGNALLMRSERSSSSYFLHRKKLESLDRVRLQLDHNASRACNHNALRR